MIEILFAAYFLYIPLQENGGIMTGPRVAETGHGITGQFNVELYDRSQMKSKPCSAVLMSAAHDYLRIFSGFRSRAANRKSLPSLPDRSLC
jgi:hypothetical protein